jgi:hypothetical protein
MIKPEDRHFMQLYSFQSFSLADLLCRRRALLRLNYLSLFTPSMQCSGSKRNFFGFGSGFVINSGSSPKSACFQNEHLNARPDRNLFSKK